MNLNNDLDSILEFGRAVDAGFNPEARLRQTFNQGVQQVNQQLTESVGRVRQAVNERAQITTQAVQMMREHDPLGEANRQITEIEAARDEQIGAVDQLSDILKKAQQELIQKQKERLDLMKALQEHQAAVRASGHPEYAAMLNQLGQKACANQGGDYSSSGGNRVK